MSYVLLMHIVGIQESRKNNRSDHQTSADVTSNDIPSGNQSWSQAQYEQGWEIDTTKSRETYERLM